MTSGKYRAVFFSVVFFASTGNFFPREKYSGSFIGLNPSVTVEPYYEDGEFDINVLPVVWQRNVSPIADIRFISILNYGFRKKSGFISHAGFQLACPLYFFGKPDPEIPLHGIFLAPGFGVTRNIGEEHSNAGLWIESGYSFLFDDGFALSLSVQYGATHFWYDEGSRTWGSHFGVKVILGQWLRKK